MYKYFSKIVLLLLVSISAFAQTDSTTVQKKEESIKPIQRQLRLGVNISTPVISTIVSNDSNKRSAYELTVDYCLKNDVYVVLEGGFGNSTLSYNDLNYTTTNSYARIGLDKSMLQRLFANDWDMIFIGIRYGLSIINRSEATFVTNDPFWGTTTGIIPAKNLTAHWAELNIGMRVELLKHFFAGYNIRTKFLINDKAFRELPPAYVAGYGKVEKSTVFDFNLYLCYALRW